jgi:hypothetical protein
MPINVLALAAWQEAVTQGARFDLGVAYVTPTTVVHENASDDGAEDDGDCIVEYSVNFKPPSEWPSTQGRSFNDWMPRTYSAWIALLPGQTMDESLSDIREQAEAIMRRESPMPISRERLANLPIVSPSNPDAAVFFTAGAPSGESQDPVSTRPVQYRVGIGR